MAWAYRRLDALSKCTADGSQCKANREKEHSLRFGCPPLKPLANPPYQGLSPMKRFTLTSISFVLLCIPLPAAETAARPISAKVDEYIQARMKLGRFSGTVLIAKDGQALYAKGYGLANIEHDVPNTVKTKFRLASVSKQFVATGLMILEHEGKLKVEDPLKKHLPD